MLTVTPRHSLRQGALALLLLSSVAAAQTAQWAADDPDEAVGALPAYSVVLFDTLSQEHVVGTLFDLRRDFDIADPPSRTIAVGGSFTDFQQFGEVQISFNEAVMYGSDGAVYDIGKSLTSDAHGLISTGRSSASPPTPCSGTTRPSATSPRPRRGRRSPTWAAP